MRRAYLALPLSLLLLTPGYAANAADPPARVGRLSYAEGTVSFHPPGQNQGDWAPATVNYPVTTGESFWTDANARAAIEIGPAELRLDQATELDIARLDDRATDLQLDQGVLNLHIAQMPAGELSIVTPRGRVAIIEPGDYDIDAGQPDNGQPSDQLEVSVFSGAARIQSGRGAIDIPSGQAALINGEPMDVQLVAASPSDFDSWAQDQEHKEDLAKLPKVLPPAVTGYQDLAAYGRWSDDPDYGEVWYPSDVPAGWAPYRYGHWAWVDPWGWTWIDDAPWGFAPFHYGRWIDRDDRWAWIPEDIPPQPVYAPALVAFVGGDGWGVDLAAGAAVAAIGWVALAPHEPYHPHYHASEAYDRHINGRDWDDRRFAAGDARLENFHNRQAATVVPTAAFTHAAPVQRAAVHVAPDQLAQTRTAAAAVTSLRPSAFARTGRADPRAAAAIVPHADAPAQIARGPVTASTPPALAEQKAPTAPAPHRVSAAARPIHANAPASAAATATNRPAPAAAPNPAAATAQARPPGEAPRATNGAGPVWQQRAAHPNEPQAPAASANLAPHPAPPRVAPSEIAHAAPTARTTTMQPAAQPRAEAAAPNRAVPSQSQRHAPAAPPARHQAATLRHENAPAHPAPAEPPAPSRPEPPHNAPSSHAAAPAQQAGPQLAHAPAPMPPRAAPAPHAVPAPHSAAAPAPRPSAAAHAAAASAPHPAAAPAPQPHHAPAAKAPPQQHDKDKKDPGH